MSRNVQLIVLCEDTQHETFIRRFLKKKGVSTRRLRVEKSPNGRGSGEQFVRNRFPLELMEYRRRHVANALIVMIDGDSSGVTARLNALEGACKDHNIDARQNSDKVAIFIPTWNIETWFAYLDGQDVDENRKNYPKFRCESDCQPHVDSLAGMCEAGQLREPVPAALKIACCEYSDRIGSLFK